MGGLKIGVAEDLDLEDRSVEGAIQVVDSSTPVARAFVRFGGPKAHGLSLTVVAQKRSYSFRGSY